MKLTFVTLAALILATTAYGDRADDAAILIDCAQDSDSPQDCIGMIATPCLEMTTNPTDVEACYIRETAAWGYAAPQSYLDALKALTAIRSDLPSVLATSQNGWEDYAANHCLMVGLSEPDSARQPIIEAQCAMNVNAKRIIELMFLGQP